MRCRAICASLVDRDRTGRGQRVDVPMFETMAGFVMGDHMGGLTYEPPLDKGGYARHLSPDRRPYRTSDGYICVIVYNDKQWQNFFDATGRDDLRTNPKFATFAGRAGNIDVVYAELARILRYLLMPIGAAIAISPWLLDGGQASLIVNGLAGAAMILLSVRRGPIREHYGTLDKLIR